jgi:hypothetical protein
MFTDLPAGSLAGYAVLDDHGHWIGGVVAGRRGEPLRAALREDGTVRLTWIDAARVCGVDDVRQEVRVVGWSTRSLPTAV